MINTTTNRTTAINDDEIFTVVLSWTVGIISFIGSISNILVITTTLGNKSLRTVASAFLINLASCDLLISLFIMPFLASNFKSGHWTMSQNACVGLGITNHLLQTSSIFTVTVIAIDRYITIVHCLKHSSWSQPRYVTFLLTCVWISSTLFTIPLLFPSSAYIHYDESAFMCVPNWKNKSNKVLFSVILTYAIPVVILLMCYLKIICVARGHARKISDMTKQVRQNICLQYWDKQTVFGPETFATVTRTVMLGYPDSNVIRMADNTKSSRKISDRSLSRFEREARAAVRLIGLLVAFMACWSFQNIVDINNSYDNIIDTPSWVPAIGVFMTMFQSALNPFLYALMSKRFRFAMNKMFKKWINRVCLANQVQAVSLNKSRNVMPSCSIIPMHSIKMDSNKELSEHRSPLPGATQDNDSYHSIHYRYHKSRQPKNNPHDHVYLSIPKKSIAGGKGALKIETIHTCPPKSNRKSAQFLRVNDFSESQQDIHTRHRSHSDTKIRICVDLTS